MTQMTDEEREHFYKTHFITALYPVNDIFVLWELDKDDDDYGKADYGAERATFLALCADGEIRAVVFADGYYDLCAYEGEQCRGFYEGKNLPDAKIIFWDGSKDPRGDVTANGDAET